MNIILRSVQGTFTHYGLDSDTNTIINKYNSSPVANGYFIVADLICMYLLFPENLTLRDCFLLKK